jgi:hypothetical protein
MNGRLQYWTLHPVCYCELSTVLRYKTQGPSNGEHRLLGRVFQTLCKTTQFVPVIDLGCDWSPVCHLPSLIWQDIYFKWQRMWGNHESQRASASGELTCVWHFHCKDYKQNEDTGKPQTIVECTCSSLKTKDADDEESSKTSFPKGR